MSQVPVTIDICRSRGDNFPFQFTIQDSAGVAIDITGFSFLMTVDPEPDPSDALNNLFQLTGTIVDGPNGRVDFEPTTVDMDQTPDTYFYDVQMIDVGLAVRTAVKGEFEIQQDITK